MLFRSVLALGILKLVFESHTIVLNDCHFCPSFFLNIISVGLLTKNDYEILIKKQVCNIIMNDVTIFCGHLNNDVYMLSQPVNIVYSIGKHPRLDSVSDIYLWHYKLGHINKNRINRLTEEEIFEVSDCESLLTCEFCLLGKMTSHLLLKKMRELLSSWA